MKPVPDASWVDDLDALNGQPPLSPPNATSESRRLVAAK